MFCSDCDHNYNVDKMCLMCGKYTRHIRDGVMMETCSAGKCIANLIELTQPYSSSFIKTPKNYAIVIQCIRNLHECSQNPEEAKQILMNFWKTVNTVLKILKLDFIVLSARIQQSQSQSHKS